MGKNKNFIILGSLQDFILENALRTNQGGIGWGYDLTFFLMISLEFLIEVGCITHNTKCCGTESGQRGSQHSYISFPFVEGIRSR